MGGLGRAVGSAGVAAVIAAIAVAAFVTWKAVEPAVTKACADPGMQPADAAWTLVATEHGRYSAAGDVNGSARRWERPVGGGAWILSLFSWDNNSPEGDIPRPTPSVIVRGSPATIEPLDSALIEVGSGYVVSWREGLLGCTYFDLRLSGESVTEADLLAIAATLR